MTPELLAVLKAGSVEGEEFTVRVVASTCAIDSSSVVEILSREAVEQHRLVTASGPVRFGGVTVLRYRFRHLLFQRYVYKQLDEVERSHLHGLVAAALSELAEHGVEGEIGATLAYHYEQAGMVDDAVRALSLAVRRSIRRSANRTAVELATRALSLIEVTDPSRERDRMEFELQLQMGTARTILSGFAAPDVGRAFTRASELAEVAGTPAQLMQVYYGLRTYLTSWGDFNGADEMRSKMFALVDSSGDQDLLLQALHSDWPDALFRGDIDGAIERSRRGRGLYRREVHHPLTFRFGNHDAAVCSLAFEGLASAIRGEASRASTLLMQAIDLSGTFDHPITAMQPAALLTWVHQINEDRVLAISAAQAVIGMDIAVPVWVGVASAVEAWATAGAADNEESIERLSREYKRVTEIHHGWLGFIGSMYIEVLLASGRLSEALPVAQRLSQHEGLVGGFYASEILRTVGLTRIAEGRVDEGHQLLHDAAEKALNQHAYTFALRAAINHAEAGGRIVCLRTVVETLPAEVDHSLRAVANDLLA